MISVHETEKLSLQEIEKFLLAAQEVRFEASQREEVYGWIERLLCQQEYERQVQRLKRRYQSDSVAWVQHGNRYMPWPVSLPRSS